MSSNNNLLHLPIDQLQANPFQPREKVKTEDIQDLADSIKTFGLLEPLVVAQTPAGYQIIAGERRWRAAKLAGLTEVPVHIKKTTPKGMLEMAIIENVQREDLAALERAQAFLRLRDEFHLSVEDVAKRISMSKPHVANTIRLLKLPDAIKDALSDGDISETHARALLGLTNPETLLKCFRQVLSENATVSRTEELVRHYKKHTGQKPGRGLNSKVRVITDENVQRIQDSLRSQLRHKTDFKLKRSNRQTKMTIIIYGDKAMTQADCDKVLRLISGN